MSIKIAIRSHAYWTDMEFNVSARGEGRWALNLTQLLIKQQYDVYLIADSIITIPRVHPFPNCTVCPAKDLKKYEPFDLYIDPAWGFTQNIYAKSKYILGNTWTSGKRKPWDSSNLIRTYPYDWYDTLFKTHSNMRAQQFDMSKMFLLPAPFGEKFVNYEDKKRTEALLPSRFLEDSNQTTAHTIVKSMLTHLNGRYHIHAVNTTEPGWKQNIGDYNVKFYFKMNYNTIKDILSRSVLNLSRGHSCVLDAIFQGCPPLLWQDGWYSQAVEDTGLLIRSDSSNLIEVLDILLNDSQRRDSYIKGLQSYVSPHLESNVIHYFNNILSNLGL